MSGFEGLDPKTDWLVMDCLVGTSLPCRGAVQSRGDSTPSRASAPVPRIGIGYTVSKQGHRQLAVSLRAAD